MLHSQQQEQEHLWGEPFSSTHAFPKILIIYPDHLITGKTAVKHHGEGTHTAEGSCDHLNSFPGSFSTETMWEHLDTLFLKTNFFIKCTNHLTSALVWHK